MGQRHRSDQSNDDGDSYVSRTATFTDEEQEVLDSFDGDSEYPDVETVEEAFEDTILEEHWDELAELHGDEEAEMKMLNSPEVGAPDGWEVPAPTPEESEAFRQLEATPVVGSERQPDEVLDETRQKTLAAAKQHLKALNNPEMKEKSAENIGVVVAFVPSEGQSSVGPSAGTDKDSCVLTTKRSIGENRAQHESTIKHEMVHVLLDSYGYRVQANEGGRYDPKEDNFVEIDPSTENRIIQYDKETPPPRELNDLVRAAEDSWLKLQNAGREGDEQFDRVALDPTIPNSRYPSVAPDETLTQFHQVMQHEDVEPRVNWFFEHGNLTEKYTEVFTPSETKREAISYLHESHPDASPFESNPYPDHEPEPDTKAALDAHADVDRYEGPG